MAGILLVEAIDIHAQCSHGETLVVDAERAARAAGEIQWQQVFVTGVAASGVRGLLAVIVQRCLVVVGEFCYRSGQTTSMTRLRKP